MNPLLLTIGIWSHIFGIAITYAAIQYRNEITDFGSGLLAASLIGATYFWLEVLL